MSEIDCSPGAGRRKGALSAWLPSVIAVALILVLSGCGAGTSDESSGRGETTGSERSAGQVENQSAPETTEQGSEGGELANPALGDPGGSGRDGRVRGLSVTVLRQVRP